MTNGERMDLSVTSVNMMMASAFSRVQYAAAAKVMQTTRQSGQAAVEMVEAAAEMIDAGSQQMMAAITGLGECLDVTA